jgi:hypothetical protein
MLLRQFLPIATLPHPFITLVVSLTADLAWTSLSAMLSDGQSAAVNVLL